jgi:Domain of unknown function (DUF892)
MFERLNTPEEAYNWKLGAALKMEQTMREKILADSIDEAQHEQVKQIFRRARQSRPSTREAKTNVTKTDDPIVDSVILSGALETEHHEITVYEGLITNARAMGRDDVVPRRPGRRCRR